MKLLKLLVALLILSMSGSVFAQLYRWVDANGQVHYSDTPQAGAEEIELRQPNTFQSRSAPSYSEIDSRGEQESSGIDEDASTEESFTGYRSAVISSPNDGEVLWNIGGVVNVQLTITPRLQRGHGIVFYYDGRAVNAKPISATSVTLEDVYRGSHTVRASIFSAKGDLLLNGATTRFQVQQSTVN